MGVGFAEAPRLACSGAGGDVARKRRTTRPGRSLGRFQSKEDGAYFMGVREPEELLRGRWS